MSLALFYYLVNFGETIMSSSSSNLITTIFVLTGVNQGKTKVMGKKYPFTDGEMECNASPEDTKLIANFLMRNWQVCVKGQEGDLNGVSDISEDSKLNEQSTVSSDSEPDGTGTEAGEPENDGEPDAETETGEAGSVSDGNGQPAELNKKLLRAVNSLDHTNDEHWTQDGKPAMTAVTAAYGAADVTRKDIDEVAPEYKRVIEGQ